jgi:hypothetical protein
MEAFPKSKLPEIGRGVKLRVSDGDSCQILWQFKHRTAAARGHQEESK